ncbi:MAG TPA: branched-chain amino acid aminotransferase, partial [Nocardioidaceae bacterium]|nr:branched-chain amino acid aminotransferase [Nocardioidaceae bacterium]
ALPNVCDELFLGGVDALVRADASWVPTGDEASLYLRPFMFATEAFVGVRATRRATFAVIASPTGSYFPNGIAPIDVWLSTDHARASAGGTGAAKTGGNYAASLLPQAQAIAHGCDQVVFLDDVEHAFVEESGAMNLFFVYDDGSLVTPASDSILAGITADSLEVLAAELGHDVIRRPISIDEWRDGVRSGRITEVFACGTAAVVTPIGALRWAEGDDVAEIVAPDPADAPVTLALRRALVDIQYGRAPDRHRWMHEIVRGQSRQ